LVVVVAFAGGAHAEGDADVAAADAGVVDAIADAGVVDPPPAPTPPAPPPAFVDAGSADAGIAGSADAGSADAGTADAGKAGGAGDGHGGEDDDDPASFSVVVEELSTPLSFSVPSQGKDPRRRASEASAAFKAALRAEAPKDAPAAQVVQQDGVAIVKVRGRTVATLTIADAIAAGAVSMETFAEERETRLVEFVENYESRHSLQQLAFHIFFSVFLCVLAVLALRGLNAAFRRADAAVEDRAATIKPLVVFDVPLLSSDAMRGILATALVVGRVVSVVVVVVAATAGVMAQFERTRPLLESLASAAGRPILTGLEALVTAIPGLVLAALLVLLLQGGLRFARLLLDGVAAGRVKSVLVRPQRAPITRVVVTGAATLLALPLLVGAAFGRFGTPFETLALMAAGVVFVGAIPTLSSLAVGVVATWRGVIKPGDWVEVGGVSGEVSAVGLTELVLVPAGGGTVVVPMIMLAYKPLLRSAKQPQLEHLVRVCRDEKAAVLIDKLQAIAKSVDAEGGAEILEADHETVLVRLFIPIGKSDAHNALSRALLNAVDDGSVVLAAGKQRPETSTMPSAPSTPSLSPAPTTPTTPSSTSKTPKTPPAEKP
jgi:small-conductance mechanosensitive channel